MEAAVAWWLTEEETTAVEAVGDGGEGGVSNAGRIRPGSGLVLNLNIGDGGVCRSLACVGEIG